MLITEIVADDVLSFRHLELQLQPGLNVIVGPNDVGKSNLVRLVRLVRELVTAHPWGSPASQVNVPDRYVRLDAVTGSFELTVRLTEDHERALMTQYVWAVAARAAEGAGNTQPRTPEQWRDFRAAVVTFVRATMPPALLEPLFEFRIVVCLDRREPVQLAAALEFEVDSQVYNIGLTGRTVGIGAVTSGRFELGTTPSGWTQPDLAAAMPFAGSHWAPFTFSDLLPPPGFGSQWNLTGSSSDPLPMTVDLARMLGLASDNSRSPDLAWVLRDIVGRGIGVTSNLRRPPTTSFPLSATVSGLAVEDAGDLPLELYRLKEGGPRQRAAYAELRQHFHQMTGRDIEIESHLVRSPTRPNPLGTEEESDFTLAVEPQVSTELGWVPIDHAGAGLWEALAAVAATASSDGQVTFLDEPATHLHATWQRRLLRHVGTQHQVAVITHSPFLVPTDNLDGLRRVTRLRPGPDGPRCAGLGNESIPDGWLDRWRQIVAGSTDLRAVLFSAGVVLVEGETELGAFRHWFNAEEVVGDPAVGIDGQNVLVLPVDGDRNFGTYVSYLQAFGVPWVAIADGPALHPLYKHGLLSGLPIGASAPSICRVNLLGERPADDADFAQWAAYWRPNRVLTVAREFGLNDKGEKLSGGHAESGEVESFFRELDPELWAGVQPAFTSKVRRGYAFAERLPLPADGASRARLRSLWAQVLEGLSTAVT